jgi:transposase
LLGDKAYSTRAHRTELRRRGIKVVIPEPSDQAAQRKRNGSRGGRAVTYDVHAHRNRNVAERSFNTLKNWRRLATRCDKKVLVYQGGVVPASILLWLRCIRRHALAASERVGGASADVGCPVDDGGVGQPVALG